MILSMKVISLGFDLDRIVAKEKKAKDEGEPAAAATDREEHGRREQDEQQQHKRARKRRNANETKSEPKSQGPDLPESEVEIMTGNLPTVLEYLGYVFCPGNCVFGPWIKYEEYLRLFKYPRWVRKPSLSPSARREVKGLSELLRQFSDIIF